MTRVVIGWKSVLYQSTVYKAELKLSRHLLDCTMSDLFWDFFLAFFFVNLKWIFGTSEPASSNRRAERRFVNMPSDVIYVIITWAETKVFKEKTKWTAWVLNLVSSRICKLTYGNKNQTQLTDTPTVYIVSSQKQNKTGMMKNIARLA